MAAGETWKKKREALGMSIDDMSIDLRIAPKYLRGIEEGNWEGWPVRVFSAGFIRAYARKLSMDPEPVLSEYFRYVDGKAGTEPSVHVRPEWLEREKERGSRRTIYTIAAGAVLVVGIGLAWYSTRTVPKPPKAPQVPVAAAPAPAPAIENAAPAPEAPAPNNAAGNKGKGAQPPAAGRDRKPAGAAAPNALAAGTGAPAARATAGTPGAAGGPYQLLIEAKETTWILYGRDNEAQVDATLQPGDRISIQAQKAIFLKLGNAGGVTATLNGKPLPPFGEAGRVKVYRLGK